MKQTFLILFLFSVIIVLGVLQKDFQKKEIAYSTFSKGFPLIDEGVTFALFVKVENDGMFYRHFLGLHIESIVIDGENILPERYQGAMVDPYPSPFDEMKKGIRYIKINFTEFDPFIVSAHKLYYGEDGTVHFGDGYKFKIKKPLLDIKQMVIKYRYRFSKNNISPLYIATIDFEMEPITRAIYTKEWYKEMGHGELYVNYENYIIEFLESNDLDDIEPILQVYDSNINKSIKYHIEIFKALLKNEASNSKELSSLKYRAILKNLLRFSNEKLLPIETTPLFFKYMREKSILLSDDLPIIEILENILNYNPGYNKEFISHFSDDQKPKRLELINKWESWYNQNYLGSKSY